MKCDLCQVEDPAGFARPVHVEVKGKSFGDFCSRFCAIHALVGSISIDAAEGQSKARHWENGELLPKGEEPS